MPTLTQRFPVGRTVRNRNTGREGTVKNTDGDKINVHYAGYRFDIAELAEDIELIKYRPGYARVGEPTPQSDPDMFTVAEIKAEIRHLRKLNDRLGEHPLRTAAALKLAMIVHGRM